MLDRAIAIATEVHKGQTDKAGDPYILHPIRVMMRMETIDEMVTAILHDVIEDSQDDDKWSIERLKKEGFSQDILDALVNLTRGENETYEAFIERAEKLPLSRKVKIADLEDNMNMMRIKNLTEKDSDRLMKYHKSWLKLKKIDSES